jgi:hypothetical protein
MTEPRTTPDMAYSVVLETTRAYLAETGRVQALRAYYGVAGLAGFDAYTDAFMSQVKRSLDQLTKAGELIKVPRGHRTPAGAYANSPYYYTPAEYTREQENAQASKTHADLIRARWEAVHDKLGLHGITNKAVRGTGVSLALPVWETLLKEGKL